jgi:hypothetical protein
MKKLSHCLVVVFAAAATIRASTSRSVCPAADVFDRCGRFSSHGAPTRHARGIGCGEPLQLRERAPRSQLTEREGGPEAHFCGRIGQRREERRLGSSTRRGRQCLGRRAADSRMLGAIGEGVHETSIRAAVAQPTELERGDLAHLDVGVFEQRTNERAECAAGVKVPERHRRLPAQPRIRILKGGDDRGDRAFLAKPTQNPAHLDQQTRSRLSFLQQGDQIGFRARSRSKHRLDVAPRAAAIPRRHRRDDRLQSRSEVTRSSARYF